MGFTELRRRQIIGMCLKRKGLPIELISKLIMKHITSIYFAIKDNKCDIELNNPGFTHVSIKIGPVLLAEKFEKITIKVPPGYILYAKEALIHIICNWDEYKCEKYKHIYGDINIDFVEDDRYKCDTLYDVSINPSVKIYNKLVTLNTEYDEHHEGIKNSPKHYTLADNVDIRFGYKIYPFNSDTRMYIANNTSLCPSIVITLNLIGYLHKIE
jgi:hypothetical protein